MEIRKLNLFMLMFLPSAILEETEPCGSPNSNQIQEPISPLEVPFSHYSDFGCAPPQNISYDPSNSTPSDRAENSTALPPSLGFDENARDEIIVYSILFVIAASGNLTVFFALCRSRHWKSRVNLMVMHLAAADLIVTFIMIPLEVGWRITTQWLAGNAACKVLQLLRAFGLYLSSLVLVCISLDRYFAVIHPLKVNDAQRRGKMMLAVAWTLAAACSLPQSVIFHVDSHPDYPSFRQCVTFGFFRSQSEEVAYNLFCLSVMYFFPLLIIVVAYMRILWVISQKSKDSRVKFLRELDETCITYEETAEPKRSRRSRMLLRRSDISTIERARARSLKMTIIIVLAFIWCWTPYVVMVMWYMFDRPSAEKVNRRLQDALFIMAVSNSCVNPLVYGTYNLNLKQELGRCFGHVTAQPSASYRSGRNGSTSLRRKESCESHFRQNRHHSRKARMTENNSPQANDGEYVCPQREKRGTVARTHRMEGQIIRAVLPPLKCSSPKRLIEGDT